MRVKCWGFFLNFNQHRQLKLSGPYFEIFYLLHDFALVEIRKKQHIMTLAVCIMYQSDCVCAPHWVTALVLVSVCEELHVYYRYDAPCPGLSLSHFIQDMIQNVLLHWYIFSSCWLYPNIHRWHIYWSKLFFFLPDTLVHLWTRN